MLKENCGIFSEDEVDLKATFGAKSKYGRLQRKHQIAFARDKKIAK